MSSFDTVASSLVNFSYVGFIIIFGTATFIPMVYELAFLRKNESVILLRHYPYRLISRLALTKSTSALMIISLLFAGSGLLSLFYILLEREILIKLSLWFSVITVSILIIFIICILISALPYKEHEIAQIIEYFTSESFNKK